LLRKGHLRERGAVNLPIEMNAFKRQSRGKELRKRKASHADC